MRTLAHLSDIHFGRLDEPVAASLLPYLTALAPDLLILSGDFSQRAGHRQFRDALAYLRQFPFPHLYIPGNHDIPMYAVWERFLCPLRRYRKYIASDLSPFYEDNEVLVAGLSSARPFVFKVGGFWKDGYLTRGQLQPFLTRARAVPNKVKILVTHHPFHQAPHRGRDGVILYGPRILPLLASVQTDLLLAGHLHIPSTELLHVGDWAGLSIQAGTATSYRRRHDPDGMDYSNSFNLLRISPQPVPTLNLEIHSCISAVWQHVATHVFTRHNNSWQAVQGA